MILFELPSTKKELSKSLELAQAERARLQKSFNLGQTLVVLGGLIGLLGPVSAVVTGLVVGPSPEVITLFFGSVGTMGGLFAYSSRIEKRIERAEKAVSDAEYGLQAIELEQIHDQRTAEVERGIREELEAFAREDSAPSDRSDDSLDRLVKLLARASD